METPSSKGLLPRENPYGRAGFLATLSAQGLDSWNRLCDRALGTVVTNHRSSWVRRIEIDAAEYFVKTYDYPSLRDRLRGLGRTTALAHSRARREARGLGWLRAHGFEAPEPVYAGENRRLGLLVRAVLVSARWPGRRLDRTLEDQGDGAERASLRDAVIEEVERLHRAGFRHRNLDPRNVLVAPTPGGAGWRIAFLDAPRHRLVRPSAADAGRPDDAGTREDWRRLGFDNA